MTSLGEVFFQPARKTVFCLLGFAAIVKIGVLLVSGPSFHNDSQGYITYADAILDHARAFAPAVWGAEAAPLFIFRLPGYPLFLAGTKLLSGVHYAFLTVIFQGVLTGIAVYLIYRVTERLFLSTAAALFVSVLYLFSESMLYDNSILSDSLYASLFNIVLFGFLGQLIGCWRLRLAQSASLATLWGYSILTRDSGLYFTFLPIILTIAIAVQSEGRFVRRIGHFLVFALVTSGIIGAYSALNWYRTGETFLSITGLENWLHPVVDMERHGYAQPFKGEDLVSSTVRETISVHGFEAQKEFLKKLHSECQCTPTQEQSLVFAKYLSAVSEHPIAYLRVVWGNFSRLGSVIADPVWTINEFVQLGTPVGRILPGLSLKGITALMHDFSIIGFILLILVAISTILSTAAFWAFIFGIPVLLAREWNAAKRINYRLAVTSFLWLVFMSVALAFSMVHFEMRYALPVIPAALVGVVYMLQRLAQLKILAKPPNASRASSA
jgi:hypothetical protein